jgi:hypothetical protein
MATDMQANLEAADEKRKGDLRKGVRRMVDVVTSERMAVGRPMRKRLPLGTDSLRTIWAKCIGTLRLCEEWKELIASTYWDEEQVQITAITDLRLTLPNIALWEFCTSGMSPISMQVPNILSIRIQLLGAQSIPPFTLNLRQLCRVCLCYVFRFTLRTVKFRPSLN